MFEAYLEYLKITMAPCIFVEWFGHECPGCGLQRALILLLQGDLIGSIKSHPALIPGICLSFYFIAHLYHRYKRGGKVLMWGMIGILTLTITHYVFKEIEHFSHHV